VSPAPLSAPRRDSWLCSSVGRLAWLALLASLVPYAQGLWWALELPGHFRMQLSAFSTLAAVAMLWCRRVPAGAVLAAAAVLNTWQWAPLYLPDPTHGMAAATIRGAQAAPGIGAAVPVEPAATAASGWQAGLRLVTFNVNAQTGKPAAVRAYLDRADFDVVILQEYARPMAQALSKLEYPFKVERPRADNFGIAVFSRFPITDAEVLTLDTAEVPSIRAELSVAGRPLHLLATHPLPPVSADDRASRDRQLAALADALPAAGAVVLAGDLNSTPWSPQVRRLRRASGLLDSARGFGVQPTWPSLFPPLWIPIDHVLHSAELVVTQRATGPACGSDHFPLEVTLALAGTAAAP
jgi:endonuclease/exonuclease/phosphatase (EEP) superfamily protein YafD